jgi:hypothetical protein
MSILQELIEVADGADSACAQLAKEDIETPLSAIRKVAQEADRSWSGSNIGYHATVYFAGLNPAPPDAQFSSEWGLMRRWPTHEPHPGWQLMDYKTVYNILIERAGRPDAEKIGRDLASIRQTFSALKERAISALMSTETLKSDAFLNRKLTQIDALSPSDPPTIARGFLPSSQFWSRDSQAMSQGLQLPPHQPLMAIDLSAGMLRSSLETLAIAAREAATHIQKSLRKDMTAGATLKTVFIGHGRSPLWRELMDFIEKRLKLHVEEFNSVSAAGITTVDRLSTLLDTAGFALLIMTAEDEQADGKMRARENVIHEVGLFQGRIGFNRAIVLIEEGCEEFSNIHGLGQIRFPRGHIGAKFEEIREVLEREKLI